MEFTHLPLMFALTRLAVGLEPLSVPDADIVSPNPTRRDGTETWIPR